MSPDQAHRDFFARSMGVLSEESPKRHRAICQALAPMCIRVEIDDEAFLLLFHGTGFVATDDVAEGLPDMTIQASGQTLARLLRGELLLTDALTQEWLMIRGRLEAISQLEHGLRLYLRAGMHSPSFPSMYDNYQARLRRAHHAG